MGPRPLDSDRAAPPGYSPMSMDAEDIAWLARGTPRQRETHRILRELDLFAILGRYRPALAGTIPLGVDVEGSDLDILCEVYDPAGFEGLVADRFGGRDGFRIRASAFDGLPTVVANFTSGLPVELFGQPRPAREQAAYRHLAAEARLLTLGGEPARRAIRALKRAGVATEPAFARAFGLRGDPYRVLADLADLSDEALGRLVRPFGGADDRP